MQVHLGYIFGGLAHAISRQCRRSIEGAKVRTAYDEQNGPARKVLDLGKVETSQPCLGEVRVKPATPGVNLSDVEAIAAS